MKDSRNNELIVVHSLLLFLRLLLIGVGVQAQNGLGGIIETDKLMVIRTCNCG